MAARRGARTRPACHCGHARRHHRDARHRRRYHRAAARRRCECRPHRGRPGHRDARRYPGHRDRLGRDHRDRLGRAPGAAACCWGWAGGRRAAGRRDAPHPRATAGSRRDRAAGRQGRPGCRGARKPGRAGRSWAGPGGAPGPSRSRSGCRGCCRDAAQAAARHAGRAGGRGCPVPAAGRGPPVPAAGRAEGRSAATGTALAEPEAGRTEPEALAPAPRPRPAPGRPVQTPAQRAPRRQRRLRKHPLPGRPLVPPRPAQVTASRACLLAGSARAHSARPGRSWVEPWQPGHRLCGQGPAADPAPRTLP